MQKILSKLTDRIFPDKKLNLKDIKSENKNLISMLKFENTTPKIKRESKKIDKKSKKADHYKYSTFRFEFRNAREI